MLFIGIGYKYLLLSWKLNENANADYSVIQDITCRAVKLHFSYLPRCNKVKLLLDLIMISVKNQTKFPWIRFFFIHIVFFTILSVRVCISLHPGMWHHLYNCLIPSIGVVRITASFSSKAAWFHVEMVF